MDKLDFRHYEQFLLFPQCFNPFPQDKILDQNKLKAFADNKLNVTKMIISVFDKSRKHGGKRRNCLYKQFLLFPQCFQQASFPDPSKDVTVWGWVKKDLHYRDVKTRVCMGKIAYHHTILHFDTQ